MKNRFADVAVELPLDGTFVYSVPVGLSVAVGSRVLVPFGRRRITGYVVGLRAALDIEGLKESAVKEILDSLDSAPLFGVKRLKFFLWLSSYYFAPPGMVLSLIHPPETSLKSFRYIRATDKGTSLLVSLKERTGEEYGGDKGDIEVLRGIEKSIKFAAVERKFGRKLPVHSIVSRLKRAGLLVEEVKLKSGIATKVESFAELNTEFNQPAIEAVKAALKRAPLQVRIYSYIEEHGKTRFSDLRRELGGVDGALNALVKKGLLNITKERIYRNPSTEIRPISADHTPNSAQASAIEAIAGGLRSGGYQPFLLYGVTGSGKTFVYLKALEEVVAAGGRALFLVPETALAQWPVAYLADRFPGRVAVMHSALSAGERFDEWQRIVDGEADIVVGARSALFAPIKELKLIIVDEEHEASYKQEEGVRYHGRDCALMLAKTLGITVVLGSATPSVETFYNAGGGASKEISGSGLDTSAAKAGSGAGRGIRHKIEMLRLPVRASGASLPETEIVDMRGKKGVVLSDELSNGLKRVIEDGHQAILLLNRRGYSNSILCRDCGRTFECLNCSVTLTLHKRRNALVCHYCDFTLTAPTECPDCASTELVEPGMGTERLEEEVRALAPKSRLARMDRDTTRAKGASAKIIEAMESREADILVGTQMVSKGHHFPGATFVGIVAGDTSLTLPDFRASERTFQLVTQAAGRAGRGEVNGTVVIQTLNPEHYAFITASKHDYEAFYSEEIALREEVGYPPFKRLCSIRVEATEAQRAERAATLLGSAASSAREVKSGVITVLGPVPAFLARVKGRYRWQMLLKASDVKALHCCAKSIRATFLARMEKGVTITLDVDPITIL